MFDSVMAWSGLAGELLHGGEAGVEQIAHECPSQMVRRELGGSRFSRLRDYAVFS